MNRFYSIPAILQWLIALILMVIFFFLFGTWKNASEVSWLIYLLLPLILSAGQFLMTPFAKLCGLYNYLSPMLLRIGNSKKKVDLHFGTPFDHLMVMRGISPGVKYKNKMLEYFLEGMLEIIDQIEQGKIPETAKIRGSSYFFSDRTSDLLGLEMSKTGWFEVLNLYANYFDLTWMYSLTHGRLRWPNMQNIKTGTVLASDLVKRKEKIQKIHAYLKKKTS